MSQLKWVTSGGGPFVLMAVDAAREWLGVSGKSCNSIGEGKNDYEIACSIRDYAGLIKAGLHDILVVDDLPNDITWISRTSIEGLIVKWIGAYSDEEILDSLTHLDFSCFELLPFSFNVSSPELVLFDSAYRLSQTGDNRLGVQLEPGVYQVSFLNYDPNDRVSLNLLRLKRLGVTWSSSSGHPS